MNYIVRKTLLRIFLERFTDNMNNWKTICENQKSNKILLEAFVVQNKMWNIKNTSRFQIFISLKKIDPARN